ncbi:MAG: MFS transporter [Candidatus Bathyarchaeia archaeon]
MKVNRNVKVALIGQSIFMFSFQFLSSYSILYAQFLGASGLFIGLLLFISALSQGAISLYTVEIIRRYSLKKVILLGVIIDVAAILLFISIEAWHFLFIPFILLQMIRMPPLTDAIITRFTAFKERGTIFGLSRFLNNICLFISSMVAATIFSLYQVNAQSIRILFSISLLPLIMIFIIMLLWFEDIIMHNVEMEEKNAPKMHFLQGYINMFKSQDARFIIIVRLMRECALQLLMTFMPLWLVKFRGVTGSQLGVLIVISTFTSLICQIPAGKLTDIYGRKRVFYILDIFYCVGILLSIFAPNEYLLLAALCGMGAFGGGAGGAAMVPLFTMWWESVPVNSIYQLYGLDGIIISVARIFSLLWGLLWDLKLNIVVLLIPF